ncbi:hypothetical protein JYU34_015653 [Plutella xylostella]|uniref:Cytochrome P450 n=1 Tax=Plutella xylostella TaxID=51655 RepID=A0ABQ7Q861_PLUXY|nr:hypothetical protein JYU34_015653 [Plutella xylostella]
MWVTIIAGAILLLLILKLFYNQEKDPLDDLPSPPKLPIVGHSFSLLGITPVGFFEVMRLYNKLYGDRYLIKVMNRKIVQISSPQDIEAVLSHSKNIKKSFPYTLIEPWLGTGLLLSTGAKWHKRRKILTPTFHFNILRNFSCIIEEKSRELVQRLREQEETTVDVMPTVSEFTLNTICETAMGTRLDSDKSKAAVEYKSAIMDIGALAMKRLTSFWLHNKVVFSLSTIGKQFNKALKTVHSFSDNVILERKNNRTPQDQQQMSAALDGSDVGTVRRLAMLDLLLDAERQGQIQLDGIREEVNTFMFEGHDTTAMALTFALMLLAEHREVQDKIYEELEGIFGSSDRTPSMADQAAMKYLEAVIKETLRLYPSVPFIAREITEDFMMGDLPVKKGTEVAVHIYDLHRRPYLYADPEVFRPERFLGAGPKHPYAFVPFSAGPRNCIGQKFAMQEMKCFLSEVCRFFHLAPVTPGLRPQLLADLVLRPAHPIHVKFIRR